MKIAVAHNNKPFTLEVADKIKRLLKDRDFVLDDKYPDVVITVGGDGTLINAFHRYENQVDSIRFIGVHTGHLGFYTDWRNYDVEKLVDSLSRDDVQSAKYPLLEIEMVTESGEVRHYLAVNESAVKRVSHTLEADVYIDNEPFEKFRGDGLCVSTPTGSTAYGKSLGGAVIHPRLKALHMTEIASINNRVFRTLSSPIVIAPDQWITIIPNTDHFVMTIDGERNDLRNAKKINYRISKHSIQFDRFGHHHFWSRVKNSFISDANDDNF